MTRFFEDLLPAILVTVQLTAISLFFGLFLAALIAAAQYRRTVGASQLSQLYSIYFRGTPLLVQIFLIYYGSGQFRAELEAVGLWTLFRSPWFCVLLAFTLNTAAYTSEILLGAARAVPISQIEAGRALGLSRGKIFRFVMVPNILRSAWPAYSNEVVFQLQATSLASLVTIMDITGVARRAAASTFRFFEVYSVAAVAYLLIVFTLVFLFRRVERSLRRHIAQP